MALTLFLGCPFLGTVFHFAFFDSFESQHVYAILLGGLVTFIWSVGHSIMAIRYERFLHRTIIAFSGFEGRFADPRTAPSGASDRVYTGLMLFLPPGVGTVAMALGSASIEATYGVQSADGLNGMYAKFWLWFIVFGITIIFLIWRSSGARTLHAWHEQMMKAGQALGLRPNLDGVVGALEGATTRYQFDPSTFALGGQIVVERPTPPPHQGASPTILTLIPGRDTHPDAGLTGDPPFAAQFIARVDGPRAPAFLWLSDAVRDALVRLKALHSTPVEISNTQVVVSIDHTKRAMWGGGDRRRIFSNCVTLVSKLAHAEDIAERLYRICQTAPSPRRERSLTLLWSEYADSAAARRAAARAETLKDRHLRLRGALIHGNLPLIIATVGELPRDAYRRRDPVLIDALHAALTADDGAAHATELARRKPAQIVVVIIEVMDETQRPWADAWCAALMDQAPEHTVLVMPRWLTHSDAPHREARLIKALTCAPKTEHTLPAINVLARIGTAASVMVLSTYCDDLFDADQWKAPARRAIDAIQDRIDGGGAGQLTLVSDADEEGGLSHPTGDD